MCFGGSKLVAKSGYWRPHNDTLTIVACFSPSACVGPASANDDESIAEGCAEGHIGPFCGVCDTGYKFEAEECVPCTASGLASSSSFIFLLCLVVRMRVNFSPFCNLCPSSPTSLMLYRTGIGCCWCLVKWYCFRGLSFQVAWQHSKEEASGSGALMGWIVC